MGNDAPRAGPVRVHIEELVVDGFPGMDGPALSEAVRGELNRLIAEGGLGALSGSRAAEIAAPPVKAGTNVDASALGKSVARSVYQGLES